METIENGEATSKLPKPLAIEVFSKIHQSTLSKECLLDELDELVDEVYYPGETVLSGGKEFAVVSSEKRGGLTTYTMTDGSKIGHRDLRRRKGLSPDEIKQIAFDESEFDGKQWKVKEDVLKGIPIRTKEKYAPIFSKARKPAPPTTESSSDSEGEDGEKKKRKKASDDDDDDDDEDEEKRNGEGTSSSALRPRRSRASGAPAMRKAMEKQLLKEQKEKEKAEKKEKEKEEKKKKKEEEKARKQKEKDEKQQQGKKKNGGTMDKFVKKSGGGSPESSSTAPIFSPSKWAERRVAAGVKKLEDAWKKRDHEAFNEACLWCEKNLSGNQQKSIDNPIYRFAVEKYVDKTKDKAQLKNLKGDKKAEYKTQMAEKRKEHYKQFEPKIKAWFNDELIQDDLILTSEPLEMSEFDAAPFDVDDVFLKCLEVTQFFVSMRKILLWTENVSAEQLRRDLHAGFGGFQRSTYKMIANLLETALQEKEHEKTAHCNARLSEFPITEHTITELVRAFFVGKTEMSVKNLKKVITTTTTTTSAADAEEMESEEKEAVAAEDVENEENDDESSQEEEEEERERQRILAMFNDSCHIYEWPAAKQLDIVYAMKEVVHGLPIIREWYLKDATTDQSTALKLKGKAIEKRIEEQNKLLTEMAPEVEITDEMSRLEAREAEKSNKRRQGVEKRLDELREELEENREAVARERDDLERIFRVTSIGSDRHLRKYYWFAYSEDAGIWVQDFGTTSYEKWVRECSEKGLSDVETPSDSMPQFVDSPNASVTPDESWYKLASEKSIRSLEAALKKNGRRERVLKKYLHTNMDDIVASLGRNRANASSASRSRSQTPMDTTEQPAVEEEPSSEQKQNGHESAEKMMNGGEGTEVATEPENGASSSSSSTQKAPSVVNAIDSSRSSLPPPNNNTKTKFAGPLGPLKAVMSEMLVDWQQSGITRIGDAPLFETRMDDAHTLHEMKQLVLELVNSVPTEVLIEKFPQQVAIAKKCFSHLKMDRFVVRVDEATNSSCLHMLLAYFDARIDSQRTLPQLPCAVCRKKTGTERKVMCKQCTTVYHYTCHRPAISREHFEEDGFKEAWWCGKCKKEERRRLLAAERAASEERREREGNAAGSDGSDEEEEPEDEAPMELDEDEDNPRSRNAKRKANMAMRGVLEFEGVLRKEPAPPPPKRTKNEPLPEVLEMFESIERANPRLYKVLQQVPSQTRSLRNSHHETRSLADIEEDLDIYLSAEQLREHLSQFFQQARGYIETHNSRKLDEFDSLISELNFI